MHIQCTQKLLSKLKQPYGKLAASPNPMYCWYADCFDYNGMVYVVMLNEYGGEDLFLEVESFQDFAEQVLEVIQQDLEDCDISAEEISSYIQKAGPITFGPTSDRSKVAQVSALTRRTKESFIGTQELLDEMAIMAKQVFLPSDYKVLEEEFPTHKEIPEPKSKKRHKKVSVPTRTLMVEFDVELLLLGDKKVNRSFMMPLDVSFEALHIILQIVFDWSGLDPHMFDFKGYGFILKLMRNEPLDKELETSVVYDEETTMLSDLLPTIREFKYFYGQDQEWELGIKVGKIEYVDGVPFVKCTGGQGASPPEDCSGPSGYEDLCLGFSGPKDAKEHEARLAVFVDDFDLAFINEELEELVFTPQID